MKMDNHFSGCIGGSSNALNAAEIPWAPASSPEMYVQVKTNGAAKITVRGDDDLAAEIIAYVGIDAKNSGSNAVKGKFLIVILHILNLRTIFPQIWAQFEKCKNIYMHAND